jgi:hypothetical protein
MNITSVGAVTSAITVLWILAALVATAAVATGLISFFVENHAVRVRQHLSIPTYYGRLVTAH